MRCNVQALFQPGAVGVLLNYGQLFDQRRAFIGNNSCLNGLPRSGAQYFMSMSMLKASWHRSDAINDIGEAGYAPQPDETLDALLDFEFLTVRHLAAFWRSSLHAFECTTIDTDVPGLLDEGKVDYFGRQWRIRQESQLALVEKKSEEMVAQNYRLWTNSQGPGGASVHQKSAEEIMAQDVARGQAGTFLTKYRGKFGTEQFLNGVERHFG